jgi:hypothetical protein
MLFSIEGSDSSDWMIDKIDEFVAGGARLSYHICQMDWVEINCSWRGPMFRCMIITQNETGWVVAMFPAFNGNIKLNLTVRLIINYIWMFCYLLLLHDFKGVNTKEELGLGLLIFAISELCISLTEFSIKSSHKLSF